MLNILETDRMNRLITPPLLPTKDQTNSPVSFENWGDTRLQAHLEVGDADLRVFLVHGTGANGMIVALPRQQVATSLRSSLQYRDFGACVENSYLNLLVENLSRLVQPQHTRTAISAIKFNFSLNVSQLADILRVRRPTIYSWLDEEEDVRIQPENQRRIQQLTSYAELWWTEAGRRLPKELLDSSAGLLLLDQLKAEVLNDHSIRWLIESLCTLLPAKRPLLTVKGVGPVPRDESPALEEFID